MIIDSGEPLRGKKASAARRAIIHLIDQDLAPHSRLPGERDLAERLGITRPTLRVVLTQLEREGRVYRIHGSGTYVSPPQITKALELTSFSEDMEVRGLKAGARALLKEMVPAGEEVGAALHIDAETEMLHLRRLRTANQEPMCLEDIYLPGARFGRRLIRRALTGSLYELLRRDFDVEILSADQTIRAVALTRDEADALNVKPGSPALEVIRVGSDQNHKPIEYARTVYRAEHFSYVMNVARSEA